MWHPVYWPASCRLGCLTISALKIYILLHMSDKPEMSYMHLIVKTCIFFCFWACNAFWPQFMAHDRMYRLDIIFAMDLKQWMTSRNGHLMVIILWYLMNAQYVMEYWLSKTHCTCSCWDIIRHGWIYCKANSFGMASDICCT